MKSQCLHHDKFRDLHKLIGSRSTAHTAGYLELIWSHASQAKHGPILKRERVEKIADWIGKEGILLSALLQVRFLDNFEDDHVIIHDWKDHCPDFVKKRDYMKVYMKDKREREKLTDVSTNLGLTDAKLADVNPPTNTNLTNTSLRETNVSLDGKPPRKPKQAKLAGTQKMDFNTRAAACGFWKFHNLYPECRRVNPEIVLPLWEAAIKGSPEETTHKIMTHLKAMIDTRDYTKEGGKYCPGEVKYFEERKYDNKPLNTDRFGVAVIDDDIEEEIGF